MKIFLSVLFTIVVVIVLLYLYLLWKGNQATKKREQIVSENLKPIISAIENNTTIDNQVFKDPSIRISAYLTLKSYDKLHLFPKEYNNFISGAESSLAFWLLHPNELDAVPDEVEFVQKISINEKVDGQNKIADYYIFKFKVNAPHWAAEDGWMAGISGPYTDESSPYDYVSGTFSQLEKFDSKTPEEHFRTIYELTNKKSPILFRVDL
jgi:hypothetical protein